MARDSVNCEGMTFEEWVCAAGVAKPDHRFAVYDGPFPPVAAYSESFQSQYTDWRNGSMLYDGIILPKTRLVRTKLVNYPKKIRVAWKNGEDPTEWRNA